MHVNAAYLNNYLPAVADTSKPLIVTSCGNYKIKTRDKVETLRPSGRIDYQLLYIASGISHFYIDGEQRDLPAGSVIVYFPGQPQHYVYYRDDKTDVYWVHFTGSDVMEIMSQYYLQADDNIIFTGTLTEMRFIFEQIISELQLCRPMYEELLTLLLRNIFLLIGRKRLDAGNFGRIIESEISDAVSYFKENYNSEINIDEYAKSHHLSSGWFTKCFRQITGKTPLQYIISLRISNAQSLLENTDYTVGEIAESVGYNNPLYFSRLFHKYTGISPSQYRKKMS